MSAYDVVKHARIETRDSHPRLAAHVVTTWDVVIHGELVSEHETERDARAAVRLLTQPRRTCERCAADITRDAGRCTNRRCGKCHAAHCTPAGNSTPGHGRGPRKAHAHA